MLCKLTSGVLGHDSELLRLYMAGTTLANEMKFVMNHALGAGSIARPVHPDETIINP